MRLLWACLRQFGPGLYDITTLPDSLKVRILKAEVTETLLYACVTWTLSAKHFARLRLAHHQVLLRVIGCQRRQRTDHTTLSYVKVFNKTRCDHP